MKWIGQHIWDFISRFRSKVYLEDIENAGSDTDAFLVKKADGEVAYRSGAEVLSDIGGASSAADITAVTITTDSGGGAAASDTGGSADFSILGSSGVGVTNSGTTITAVAVPGEIDHDSLLNHSAAQHYNWAGDISGTATVHTNNITDLHGAGVDGSNNQLLTDDGDGSVTSESSLTYSSERLTIGDDDDGEASIERKAHSNDHGGPLSIMGGSATHGQLDRNGGHLKFYGGQPTGSGTWGNFKFFAGDQEGTGTTIRTATQIAQLESNAATSTDLTIYEKAGASTSDYFKLSVAEFGATTLSTVDAGGGQAHIKLDPDGDIVFTPASNKIWEIFDFHTTTFENTYSSGHHGGKVLRHSVGSSTLTIGQLYYLRNTGYWINTNADSDGGGGPTAGGPQMLGVGLGHPQSVGVLIEGFVRIPYTEILNVPGAGKVDGLPLYISTTAGHFDFTAPSDSGDLVRVVGYAIDDHTDSGNTDVLIYFNPDKTYIEIA